MHIPKGDHIVYGGQYENLERAGRQLSLTIPLTIVVVFAFLFMLFKNLKHTLITMSCILFALAILGLIPAATSKGIGSDVQRPLATVIIGGLASTLVFAPLLIPPLYRWTHAPGDEE